MSQIERETPRISVNKLGEYMTATPSRRRRIIEDQKRPRDYIVPRYTEAQDVIVAYLTAGTHVNGSLLEAIERLGNSPAASEWDEQRRNLCAEAIQSFLDLVDDLDLDGLDLRAGNNGQSRLLIAGVEVSIRPELTIIRAGASRNPASGAFKLYFSKTNPLGEESGAYVGTMVHHFVDEYPMGCEPADHRLCRVIDVFARRVYAAPRSFIRRRSEIQAACMEIARAWPDL
jgi:hypothetical protein